jgi:hypothetical protein
MSLVRMATTSNMPTSLVERHRMRTTNSMPGPFGNPKIKYGQARTLKDAGDIEMNYVERLLRTCLPSEGVAGGIAY